MDTLISLPIANSQEHLSSKLLWIARMCCPNVRNKFPTRKKIIIVPAKISAFSSQSIVPIEQVVHWGT